MVPRGHLGCASKAWGCSKRRVGKGALFAPCPRARSLAKVIRHLAEIATPVWQQIITCNVMPEAAVWPIADTGDQPVLHRIEVDVSATGFPFDHAQDRLSP
jgi:hypothetical protein